MATAPTPTVQELNHLHRSTIADAVRQVVLVIISLGFTNAIMILSHNGAGADKIHHVYTLVCSSADECGTGFGRDNLVIFGIYILVGTRFLLTNWLYLSSTYPDKADNRRLIMWPDAVGILLTGILVGLQSEYVSDQTILEFFKFFVAILIVDVVFSVLSVLVNWKAVANSGDWRHDLFWLINNVACGAIGLKLVEDLPAWPPTSLPLALTTVAILNCAISFYVTYRYFFQPSRRLSV